MAKGKTESIEFTHEEMDIIFSALTQTGKEAKGLVDKAVKLHSEDAAKEQVKFNIKLQELTQKFLHE